MATAFDLKSLSKASLAALEKLAKPQDAQSYADELIRMLVGRSNKLLDAGRSPGEAAASLSSAVVFANGLAGNPAAVRLIGELVTVAVERVLGAQARALAAIEKAEADELAMAEAAKKARVRAAVARSLQGGVA